MTTHNVTSTAGFQKALDVAGEGDTIYLKPGVYRAQYKMVGKRNVTIVGGSEVVIDGGTTATGAPLALDGCSWITMSGLELRSGKYGLVLDSCSHCWVDGLTVHHVGIEGVILRNYSTLNTVKACTIYDTGLTEPLYGEGVYIGLSVTNWAAAQSRTGGGPDASDGNTVTGCTIYGTTAECVDVKEGTTGTIITGNRLDASSLVAGNGNDSAIDIAGNDAVCSNNTITGSGPVYLDGVQTHVVVQGWANRNTFTGNTITGVPAAGYGIKIQTSGSAGKAAGNTVYDSNTVNREARAAANVPLTHQVATP